MFSIHLWWHNCIHSRQGLTIFTVLQLVIKVLLLSKDNNELLHKQLNDWDLHTRTVILVSSPVGLMHYTNDPKGNPWSSCSPLYLKQHSQGQRLSPFPSSYHWGKRQLCGQHQAEPMGAGCWVPTCQAARQGAKRNKRNRPCCCMQTLKQQIKDYYKYSYF